MDHQPISTSTPSYFSHRHSLASSLKTFTLGALDSLFLPLPLWKRTISYLREQQRPLSQADGYYLYPQYKNQIHEMYVERRDSQRVVTDSPSRSLQTEYRRTVEERLQQRYNLLQNSVSYYLYMPRQRNPDTPLYQSRGMSPAGPALIYTPDDIKKDGSTSKLEESDHTFAILHHVTSMKNKLYSRPCIHACSLTCLNTVIWYLGISFIPAPFPVRLVATWSLTWVAQNYATRSYQKKAHQQVFATDQRAVSLFRNHAPPSSPSKPSFSKAFPLSPKKSPNDFAIQFIQSMAPAPSFYDPSKEDRIAHLQKEKE